MKKWDLVSSIFWMAFSALFVAASLQTDLMVNGVPGERLFPLLTGVAGMLVSLFIFVSALFREKEAVISRFFSERGSLKRLMLAMVLLFAYAFGLNYIGYLPATFFFMLLMSRLIEPRGWWTSIVMALAAAVLTYILFAVLIGAQLPGRLYIPKGLR
jgi:Tripartite tricarboxylate transporter TctB family